MFLKNTATNAGFKNEIKDAHAGCGEAGERFQFSFTASLAFCKTV